MSSIDGGSFPFRCLPDSVLLFEMILVCHVFDSLVDKKKRLQAPPNFLRILDHTRQTPLFCPQAKKHLPKLGSEQEVNLSFQFVCWPPYVITWTERGKARSPPPDSGVGDCCVEDRKHFQGVVWIDNCPQSLPLSPA